MRISIFPIVSLCLVHLSSGQPGSNDLSDYFRSKHVINHGHVQRQLLSKQIPDLQKQQILQNYVGKSFNAKPNPSKPAERQPWRAKLGGKQGTTFILANQKAITSAVRNGASDGFDSKGAPLTKTHRTFPMMKTKINFGPPGSGSGPRKNIGVNFVNDGGPMIRHEHLRVSHFGGKINHFESKNKGGLGRGKG